MGVARSRLVIVAAAGAILVIVAGAVAVLGQSATVSLVVPPQRIETVVSLDNISIQRIDAQQTDTWQGTASTVQVAAAYATGSVRFRLVCACSPVTLSAGTIVSTASNIRYATQAGATLHANTDTDVPIRALQTGAASNQPPASVTNINSGHAGAITVYNPQAIIGGADAGMGPVVQQSDIDSARAALTAQVTNELQNALQAKAAGLTYVPDAAPSLAFKADHKVGDKTAAFTLTVTATLGGRAFANADAEATLKAALARAVRPGYRLLNSFQATYTFSDGADPNHPSVSGHAIGFAVPVASSSQIASDIKGLSKGDASSRLDRQFPGAAVRIQLGPSPIQWLPMFTNRINVTLKVAPPPGSNS